jgi:hypothetical protein
MAQSISRTEKRSRGRPKTNPQSIHLTLTPDVLSALDKSIGTSGDSRPEAIRRILTAHLKKGGYLQKG